MIFSIRFFGFLALVEGIFFGIAAAENPTYSLKLAGLNGSAVSPVAGCAYALPGDVLTVEIRVRCWSNGIPPAQEVVHTLRAYQATLDYFSFFNEPQSPGNILPRGFYELTDPNHLCPGIPGPAFENPENAFIDPDHPDWVFHGICAFAPVNSRRCGYVYGAAICASAATPLGFCPLVPEKYCATVIMEVSADAAGTFSLCLNDSDLTPVPGPDYSYLVPFTSPPEPVARILPLDFECLTIIVSPILGDVDDNGTVDLDDLICVLDAFQGFATCPGADIAPCGGDGFFDVEDIMAVLKAFEG